MNLEIDKKKIQLKDALKTLGTHTVPVKVNPKVTAEVYDLNHFPDLRERYKVMSVPCLVINDEHIAFGRKNLAQLLEMLREKGIA